MRFRTLAMFFSLESSVLLGTVPSICSSLNISQSPRLVPYGKFQNCLTKTSISSKESGRYYQFQRAPKEVRPLATAGNKHHFLLNISPELKYSGCQEDQNHV